MEKWGAWSEQAQPIYLSTKEYAGTFLDSFMETMTMDLPNKGYDNKFTKSSSNSECKID